MIEAVLTFLSILYHTAEGRLRIRLRLIEILCSNAQKTRRTKGHTPLQVSVPSIPQLEGMSAVAQPRLDLHPCAANGWHRLVSNLLYTSRPPNFRHIIE